MAFGIKATSMEAISFSGCLAVKLYKRILDCSCIWNLKYFLSKIS